MITGSQWFQNIAENSGLLPKGGMPSGTDYHPSSDTGRRKGLRRAF
jgi:hypothetical protein